MDIFKDFADLISRKTKIAGTNHPSIEVIAHIIKILYYTSIKTEEGRFVKCSVTFADKSQPDLNPPRLRRAYYPTFTEFEPPMSFTVNNLVKLSRAIDAWVASITIFGNNTDDICIWGVLDQRVHHNIMSYGESTHGLGQLGIFTLVIDGPGNICAYCDMLFLGAIRQDEIIDEYVNVWESEYISQKITPYLHPYGKAIADYLSLDLSDIMGKLFENWIRSVSRICIGVQRAKTGGTLLITPASLEKGVKISYKLKYDRLAESLCLEVLQYSYRQKIREHNRKGEEFVHRKFFLEESLADADYEDREHETTGAIRLVTSFATLDGVVLLDPMLRVSGFGGKVKISDTHTSEEIFCGKSFNDKKLSISMVGYGMRHLSAIMYCEMDENAIAIIVSQDGSVRVVSSVNGSMLLWQNAKLQVYLEDAIEYEKLSSNRKNQRSKNTQKTRNGYTDIPKNLENLLQAKPLKDEDLFKI